MGQCWTKVAHWRLCAVSKLKIKPKRNYEEDDDLCRELASGNVHLVTTTAKWEEKISEANKDGKPVAVNFSAAWCNPCRTIARTYIELADKYPCVIFLTVDVDILAEFSSSWDIKATPSFLFLKNGQKVDNLVGSNKTELQEKIMALAAGSNMRST